MNKVSEFSKTRAVKFFIAIIVLIALLGVVATYVFSIRIQDFIEQKSLSNVPDVISLAVDRHLTSDLDIYDLESEETQQAFIAVGQDIRSGTDAVAVFVTDEDARILWSDSDLLLDHGGLDSVVCTTIECIIGKKYNVELIAEAIRSGQYHQHVNGIDLAAFQAEHLIEIFTPFINAESGRGGVVVVYLDEDVLISQLREIQIIIIIWTLITILLVSLLFVITFMHLNRVVMKQSEALKKYAKSLEQSVKENETRLKLAQQVARVGSWNCDIATGDLIWSDETYRIFGLKKGSKITYDIFLEHVHPHDRERVNKAWNAAIHDGEDYDIEHRIVVKGRDKWVREKAQFDYNEKGEVVYANGTVQDITDEKQAEVTLKESNSRFQETIDLLPEGVFELDLSGNFTFVNQRAFEISGYRQADIDNGLSAMTMFLPEDRKRATVNLQKAFTGEKTIANEYNILRKDGTLLPALIHTTKIEKDGRAVGARGVIADVSERSALVEQLKQNYKQQQLVSEISVALNTPEDLDSVISDVLGKLGRHAGVSRIYIFEDIEEGKATKNIYEWNNEGVIPQIDNLQNIPYSEIPSLKKTFKKEGFLFSKNIQELPQDLVVVLEPQGIKSILMFPLTQKENGDFGFMGFDECSIEREWSKEDTSLLKTISGILSNTFERERSREKLVSSETRFRELFNGIKSGVAVLETVNDGKDFIFKGLNKAGEKIQNVESVKNIGKLVEDVLSNIEPSGMLKVVKEVWSTGKSQHELVTLARKDRPSRFMEAFVYKLKSGEIVVVFDDVTERKRSEEEITRLARVPEIDPFIIVEVTLDGEIIYMNPAAKENTGFEIVDEDGKMNNEIWESVRTEAATTAKNFELEVQDRIVDVTAIRIEDEDKILLFMNDKTEQERMKQQVFELDKLKSRFITAFTHVARTPLNEVRWAIESIVAGEFGEVSEAQVTMLQKALESENEVLQIINNMNITLDIERGTMHFEKVPTSLSSLVKSSMTELQRDCDIKDIKCGIKEPKAKIPNVSVDVEKMRIAIKMLADNGLRYSESGGQVNVSLSTTAKYVVIKVIDEGIGIPSSEQSNIFDRFFRASNAHSVHPNGVGLGLYIAKAIVEGHGGEIGFKSKEGVGSEFWIKLPRK